MACGVAVKRPHLDEHMSPSEVGGKRARTNAHCSPFRPTFVTVGANLPQSLLTSTIPNNNTLEKVGNKVELSSQQLESYLRAEVRYLKRRKLIPKRRDTVDVAYGPSYRAPGSPGQSISSDSDGETAQKSGQSFAEIYDRAQFSLKQVQLICERLLKEQEMRLRYEYETALTQRLQEQHSQYVKFTEDQIERQFENNDDISYLS